jgi:hypothetical protein
LEASLEEIFEKERDKRASILLLPVRDITAFLQGNVDVDGGDESIGYGGVK